MDKHQFPTSLPCSDVSLSNSILSLVIFLWGVQFFRGSLLFFSVHFGASNVANFILGTAIRPQNMTGNSTKRMNEFAMRRTKERQGKRENWRGGRTGSSHYSYCRRHAVRCFVRVCGKYQKRSRQGSSQGGRQRQGRGGAVEILLRMLSLACAGALRVHVKCHNQTHRQMYLDTKSPLSTCCINVNIMRNALAPRRGRDLDYNST